MKSTGLVALALSLLLASTLSGCMGGGLTATTPSTSPPPPIVPATVDAGEGTGAIEGKVLTDDLSPVAQANVTARLVSTSSGALSVLLAHEEASETRVASAEDGTFQITGLAPGTYSLNAEKPGFRPAPTRTVQVEAGETAETKLVLVALPSDVPSHVTLPFVFRLNAIIVRHPAGDQTIIKGGNLNPTDTTSYRYGLSHTVEESMTALLQTVVLETRWTPTQELCKFGLQERITGPGTGANSAARSWTQATSASPSKLRVDREGSDGNAMMSDARTELNGGKPIQTSGSWFSGADYRFLGTAGTPVDVSCAIDQRVDAWSSFFMVRPAAADFTALA